MKTFTLPKAIEVLKKHVQRYRIIKKFNGIRELSILFVDANGKKWELYSNGDTYFQTKDKFVIFEMN